MFGPGSIPKHLGEIAKEEEKQFKDGIQKLVSIRDFVLNYRVILEKLSSNTYSLHSVFIIMFNSIF